MPKEYLDLSDHHLRVLHVTPVYEPSYGHGGPPRSVAALCRGLIAAGADVTVLTTNTNLDQKVDVPLATPLERDGVTVRYYDRVGPWPLYFSPGLARATVAQLRKYDLVHVTGAWAFPTVMGEYAALALRKPYIVSPRGMLMSRALQHRSWKKRPMLRWSELPRLRRSLGIHCSTEQERDELEGLGLKEKAFVVPNSPKLEDSANLPRRGALRSMLGIPADATVVLFVGRLHTVKGIDLLTDSFLSMDVAGLNMHLVFVGPDESGYSAGITAKAHAHGLSERVHLVGSRVGRGLAEVYVDADIFSSLSESENFGMSVAEAMGYGLPVVVTAGIGISRDVRSASAGIVVPRDAVAVSEALGRLASNPGLRAGLGCAGRALVSTRYSEAAAGRLMLDHYLTLLEQLSHRTEG